MAQDEFSIITAAYRCAMAGTWDDAAGIKAAEAAYSRLYPEISDTQLICKHVAWIIGIAILTDPNSFWTSDFV